MQKKLLKVNQLEIPVYCMNTVVVGSGAASLSCADHIHNLGQTDLAIVTEQIGGGTSNNTGSDKQTYYKLSVYGKEGDCPYEMAKSLFDGGSMHGDLALIESIVSAQGFFRLVGIGVPFPHNTLGGYVGYKTDHDPRQRATSAGPWTSSQMFRCLLKEVNRRQIPIFDPYEVIRIITTANRVIGIVALDKTHLNTPSFGLTLFQAENVVFGTGGPGGLYKTSVYPEVHTGAIGIALEAGATAVNLTESQYGLASTQFRWNVSGTYQQVIPRYISTDGNGHDEREFLNPYFKNMGILATDIFLKGYQWPFDPRKIENYGSSLIDILVFIETAVKKRRVFMDFRENPAGGDGLNPFSFDDLSQEAYCYLENSNALFGKPIDRLKKMNQMAVDLYLQHGIDLEKDPLEIAVCAQHNNGGLSGDIWWESNLRHLFPIGEVNGSHGVYRPGGSALNSGQVGSLRAAQRIAKIYRENTIPFEEFKSPAVVTVDRLLGILNQLKANCGSTSSVMSYREEFRQRMTDHGSHIRKLETAEKALEDAYRQWRNFSRMKIKTVDELPDAMKNRQLVFAHIAYLEAVVTYLKAEGGSRGSYLVQNDKGTPVLPGILDDWRFKPENISFREQILETSWNESKKIFQSRFIKRRPIPETDSWFENVWNEFLNDRVFK